MEVRDRDLRLKKEPWWRRFFSSSEGEGEINEKVNERGGKETSWRDEYRREKAAHQEVEQRRGSAAKSLPYCHAHGGGSCSTLPRRQLKNRSDQRSSKKHLLPGHYHSTMQKLERENAKLKQDNLSLRNENARLKRTLRAAQPNK